MPQEPVRNLLPRLGGRQAYFDFLDRWTLGTVESLRVSSSPRALIKAYLLETSRDGQVRDGVAALEGAGQALEPIDEALYSVRFPGETEDWALAEIEDPRYPVLYTALESDIANRRVDQLISQSALLDKAWFSAPLFRRLWELVVGVFPAHRFSQIVFEYESVFEARHPVFGLDFAEADTLDLEGEDALEEEPITEHRRARMQMAERIGKLDEALEQMRPIYGPLESIVRLRMPAPLQGGHDVYFDGRFTNRSNSVNSLRQTVHDVKSIYKHSTEEAETASWPRTSDGRLDTAPISLGAPLFIEFGEPLDEPTFQRWIDSLRRKNNRFRLWCNPIAMGPGKVHLYAVDNHLWQPIDVELTRHHAYALLPAGTCGNTIHRLVANIQRFVSPRVKTFIGDRPYSELIASATITPTVRAHAHE